jgi:hypothetical protein
MKKKYIIFFAILVLIIIAIIVALLYRRRNVSQANNAKLEASEILPLISFLKNNSLQAAVVEQIIKPNDKNIYLAKSDGQNILLYGGSLGYNPVGPGPEQPKYVDDIITGSAEEVCLLPDDAEVYDGYLNKVWDISNYITGYKTNPDWSSTLARSEVCEQGPFYAVATATLSPDGQYRISWSGNKIQLISAQSGQPDKIFANIENIETSLNKDPGTFLAWSVDSNYMLIRQKTGVANSLAVYDIKNQNLIKINGSLATKIPNEQSFISFIYPSLIIYGQDTLNGGGTFAVNLNQSPQVPQMILSNDIKMVGLIPDAK